MPSTNDSTAAAELRRKKDRACDACRRRKTKCDGPSVSNHVCTNCLQTRKPCTYVEASKPRGPPKAFVPHLFCPGTGYLSAPSYITGLENRLEALEAALQQIRPGQDFSDELGPPISYGSWKIQGSSADPSLGRRKSVIANNILPPLLIPYHHSQNDDTTSHTTDIFRSPRSTHLIFRSKPPSRRMRVDLDPTLSSCSEESSDETSSSSEEAEETVISSLAGREKITLSVSENDDSTEHDNIRFHGRSSTAGLIEITRQFKHMHMKDTTSSPQDEEKSASPFPPNLTVAQWRRPTYWRRPKWEYSYENHRTESLEKLQILLEYFPPLDLADALIDLYFQHSNLPLPLLHRPTFIRQWKGQLHHRNIWFAGVCLSIFAIASRWSNDRRVLPEVISQENAEDDWRYAGRQYFDMTAEIHRIRESLLHPTSLFEVQTFTLMGIYLSNTASFPAAWLMISAGLRKTQDVGAHRKKVYRDEPNLDDELWKRAFWLLVILDRIGGVSLGRACSISEEDFDLDLPLEVDDEYYNEDTKQLKQPAGVPSTLTAFIQLIKLTQIMAFAMRTLYAINKSKIYHGVAPVDQKLITKQLSLAMSEWLEHLPEHLRWKEKMNNNVYFSESAGLFTLYHMTQMLIWRPLIGTSIPPIHQDESSSAQTTGSSPSISALTDPTTDNCTEAARACARIVEVQLQHGVSSFYIPGIINASYVCAGLFLLNAWILKVRQKELRQRGAADIKPPLTDRIEREVSEAKIFLRALEEVRSRWEVVDVLLEDLNESLIGLENPESEHDPYESKDLKKSRSVSSIRNAQRNTPLQYPQEQHEHTAAYSKDSYRSTSASPFHYNLPVATIDAFQGIDPIHTDVSQATIAPLDERSSITSAPVWRPVPYVSSSRRTSSSTNMPPPDQQFRTEEIKDTLNTKPLLQAHDAPFRADDSNIPSDDRVYLSMPRYLHDGYFQTSGPSVSSRASYERGHHRMDDWTSTMVRTASLEKLVPRRDGWRVPSSGPSHMHASDPPPNEDQYGYAPRSL